MIALETDAGITAPPRDRVLSLLHSSDITRIDEARNLIEQISEGLFESDIRKAFLILRSVQHEANDTTLSAWPDHEESMNN